MRRRRRPRPTSTRKLGEVRRDYERWFAESSDIFTDNEQFTAVLRRAERDMRMLLARTRYGRLVMAGVPWFVAPIGRDALLASLETLMLDPRPAVETLQSLTKLQGKAENLFREEEPGKIMHEIRQGELAALRAIPHTPYYGAIDTTPLYLLLLAETVMWTGDLDFFELLRDPINAALRWIDHYGDFDGDGFVEYRRRSRQGLVNQGWRDSHNAVVHADGSLAQGPIALAEVQAYVYYAKRRLAELFGVLGDIELAERLQAEAQALKARFNEHFWMEDEQYVAMALDGQKRQVKTIASTAGHCLWSRIVDDEHVQAVAQRLPEPRHVLGLGRAHDLQGRAGLQPDELLQRQRVAARQRHHRAGAQEARLHGRGQPDRHGALRGGADAGVLPAAGGLLRVHQTGGQQARLLPDGLQPRRAARPGRCS